MNTTTETPKRRSKASGAEHRRQILALHAQGKSGSEIGRELLLAEGYVFQVLRRERAKQQAAKTA